MGNKKALLIGINYTGTGNDLRGCINDANNTANMLRSVYGFTDITMLLEKDATTANIRAAMNNLVAGAVPGDVLYFHYSGHGSQMVDLGGDEADRLDEIICPYDLNWQDKVIKDDEMKTIFDKVPPGVNLTAVFDCCNSGTGLDQLEEYESPEPLVVAKGPVDGSRYLPPPAGMLEMAADLPVHRLASINRNVNTSVLLITGCEADQTSADAFLDGTYQGAATASLIKAVRENKDITYRGLIDKMNLFMRTYKFTQRPEVNGPSAMYDRMVLSSFSDATAPDVPADEPAAPVAPTPGTSVVDVVKDNKGPLVIIAVALAFAALVYFMSH